jgi:hypothetical protein
MLTVVRLGSEFLRLKHQNSNDFNQRRRLCLDYQKPTQPRTTTRHSIIRSAQCCGKWYGFVTSMVNINQYHLAIAADSS